MRGEDTTTVHARTASLNAHRILFLEVPAILINFYHCEKSKLNAGNVNKNLLQMAQVS